MIILNYLSVIHLSFYWALKEVLHLSIGILVRVGHLGQTLLNSGPVSQVAMLKGSLPPPRFIGEVVKVIFDKVSVSESSIFSKIIFDFLVRFPIISFSNQGASMKLWGI